MSQKPILISAAPFEARDLLEDAGLQEHFTYISCGIGALEAARSSAKLADLCSGRDVWFIGSAGVFGDFSEPYLVQAKATWWLPLCERLGLGESIEGLETPIELEPNTAITLPKATVICCPTIASTSEIHPKWREKLPQDTLLVENLELYCVAKALQTKAKSLNVILGITNAVGPEGRRQWRENFRQVATLTHQYCIDEQIPYRICS